MLMFNESRNSEIYSPPFSPSPTLGKMQIYESGGLVSYVLICGLNLNSTTKQLVLTPFIQTESPTRHGLHGLHGPNEGRGPKADSANALVCERGRKDLQQYY